MVTGSVDHTPRAPAPQTRNSKRWRIRVSIPVPRRCERRTLPIELIPHRSVTGVGFEPTPPKRLVPKTSALDHSAILPVCCVVNSMNDGRRYHVQVFKIQETIHCIGMSTKQLEWYSNPHHPSDWCLKPVPHTTRQSCLYVLLIIPRMIVDDTMYRCSK